VVPFVDDDVLEAKFLEGRFLNQANFVACDADFKVLWDESVGYYVCALFFHPRQDDNVDIWSPLFELMHPVLEGFSEVLKRDVS
jgi:hypothetical protein